MNQMTGVSISKKKDNSIYYRVSLTHKKRHIWIGSFDNMEDAGKCYLEGKMVLSLKDSGINPDLPLEYLSFDKYVTLKNYADNNMYLSNPIYVYQRYFVYYLSRNDQLTFDTDHLFYFASHKIMRRNQRLFVADFGMQVSVLSRFGIRPYAVAGRDYRFINGDSSDYRIENLEILSRFHGVIRVKKGNTLLYKARVHIRSYYIVGIYESELEAAIAYNKAVDILRKNGFKKQFQLNEPDMITGREYASIYAAVHVSDKIIHLAP